MPFKIALSQHEAWQTQSAPAAGSALSEFVASPKFKKLAFSAAVCLVIASISAMSDFKNSVFANLGLGKAAFSDPPVEASTLLGSTASPDRGGSSSWSLNYLVQANESFIQAAKERVVRYIIKQPPMPAAPPVQTQPNPNAIANGLNWGEPAQAGVAGGAAGIIQRMQQVQPRRPSLPQGFLHSVVSGGGGGGGAQNDFAPVAPVAQPTSSVAVAAVPTVPPAARAAIAPSVSYASHPAARAVVGGRFQSGYSSGQASRYYRSQNPSYGQ